VSEPTVDWREADPLELLSVPRAAKRLKIDPATLRAMIRAGLVNALKIGQEHRVPASALADLHEAIRRGELRELIVTKGGDDGVRVTPIVDQKTRRRVA
jgi:excisionase family DNA binding protein